MSIEEKQVRINEGFLKMLEIMTLRVDDIHAILITLQKRIERLEAGK